MRFPPYRFVLWGRLWRVRYGDPSKKFHDSTRWHGTCRHTERVIFIDPKLRRKNQTKLLWETFAHEVLHAMDGCTTGRKLTHKMIYRLEGPLGNWMATNVFFLEAPLAATRKTRRAKR